MKYTSKQLMLTKSETKVLRKAVGRYFKYELRPYFKDKTITDENHGLYVLYCKIKSLMLDFLVEEQTK